MSTHQSPEQANEQFSRSQYHTEDCKSRFNSGNTHNFDTQSSMNPFDDGDMDFELMHGLEHDISMNQNIFNSPDGSFHMDFSMFQNSGQPVADTSNVWHDPDLAPNGYYSNVSQAGQVGPQSAQGSIVKGRNQVTERFGQITPDDDERSNAFPASNEISESKRKFEEEDIAKQNRTQRARNAANKRHSKANAIRRSSSQSIDSDRGEGENSGKSTNLQREKNRLAAAKCRAKKKATSEEMQESHRDGSKMNSYLQREVRELRDQKAFLRNSLLQHEPGLCNCNAIHRFNLHQAQQLAIGVGAMIGQPMSPSQESMNSALTPSSESSGVQNTISGSGGVSTRPDMSASRPQSFQGRPSFNIGQINAPQTYPSASPAQEQAMAGQFADFLQSSPNGGRPGFS